MSSGVWSHPAMERLGLSDRERLLALGLLAAQTLLVCGHIGIFLATQSHDGRQILDFNQEWSIPTFWSAIVVAAAGGTAFAVWRRAGGLAWLIVSLGLMGIAAEEIVQLHEHLDETIGIDWPVIYAPVMILGIWAVFRIRPQLPASAQLLAVLGVTAMAMGVGAEVLGDFMGERSTGTRNLIEENLELLGSGLMLLAMFKTLHSWQGDPAADQASGQA